jgi:hypothetical protein
MKIKLTKILRNFNYINLLSLLTFAAIIDDIIKTTGVDKTTRG